MFLLKTNLKTTFNLISIKSQIASIFITEPTHDGIAVQFSRTRLMSHAHRNTLLVHVKFTTPANNWLDPVKTGYIRT